MVNGDGDLAPVYAKVVPRITGTNESKDFGILGTSRVLPDAPQGLPGACRMDYCWIIA